MAITRIFVTQDAAIADQTAGFWRNMPEDYTVLSIGPTSPLRVATAKDEEILWSDDGDDWYCIVVTLDAQDG